MSLEYFRISWSSCGKLKTIFFLSELWTCRLIFLTPTSNSDCSWRFITKQTLLYRNRLLKDSLCSDIYNDRSLASHVFSPHLSGEYKMPHCGTVLCPVVADFSTHASVIIHQTEGNHQCLCSPSLYSGATINSRGHLRLFQELSNGIANIVLNYFIFFL